MKCHRAPHAMDTALFVQTTFVDIVLSGCVICAKV